MSSSDPPSSPAPTTKNDPETETISDLYATPWARELLTSQSWSRIPFTTRDPAYEPDGRTFALLRTTLATETTIRAFVCLRRISANSASLSGSSEPSSSSRTTTSSTAPASNSSSPGPASIPEVICLISLGSPGLDSWPGTAHGGIVALVFDEVLGVAVEDVLSIEVRTASLRIDYKRAVPTPGVLLGRAKVEKTEGRKAWISATLEDGAGGVYARGECLFVKPRELGAKI